MRMTETEARAVYDVLRETCGASADGSDDFVAAMTRERPAEEYRFQGNLGFGGKFRADHWGWRVDCYHEDATRERRAMIASAHAALLALRWECSRRQADMFAQRAADGSLHCFLPFRELYVTCGPDPVVAVRLVVDEEGRYFAWWDAAEDRLLYCCAFQAGVNIYFPYGPEVEERLGRGKVVRVRVEEQAERI